MSKIRLPLVDTAYGRLHVESPIVNDRFTLPIAKTGNFPKTERNQVVRLRSGVTHKEAGQTRIGNAPVNRFHRIREAIDG